MAENFFPPDPRRQQRWRKISTSFASKKNSGRTISICFAFIYLPDLPVTSKDTDNGEKVT